jgi:hypothetical protein
MKILNRLPVVTSLTVDTTMITVDTTEITVDATLFMDDVITTTLTLVPREPIETSTNLYIYLRDELSDEELFLTVDSIQYVGDYTILTFNSFLLKDSTVYELSVVYGQDLDVKNNIRYKGKALVSTSTKTDMQDYKVTKKSSGKLKL